MRRLQSLTCSCALTGRARIPLAHRQLGDALVFNAGGLLAVKQYTSHMTGSALSMAFRVGGPHRHR